MSGLITPIASMPGWAQAITYVNPLRYFIEAFRAIYIKGSTFSQLSFNFIALSVYATVLWVCAIRSCRKSL